LISMGSMQARVKPALHEAQATKWQLTE
jgi:hypothetical protein